jgi:hypothetical protein
METGTQIILQRMKDFPEEFANDGELFGRWERALTGYKDILPREDVEAIDAAYKQMRIDRFNEKVLKALAGEEPKEETIRYKTSGRYAGGFSDPRAFASAGAKAEGQMVGWSEHAIKHQQMVEEREAQIQRDMRAKVWYGETTK